MHKLSDERTRGGLAEDDLLALFVARKDEEAFAEIVRRHGRLVLGVCHRILRQEQDAEDAFQATFLVLACRAASVCKQQSLSCFLYGGAFSPDNKRLASGGPDTTIVVWDVSKLRP